MSFLEVIDFPRAFHAAILAVLASLSMLMGAFWGLYIRPNQRAEAIVMAFGTGALIQALAIDLAMKGARRLTDAAGYSGINAWMWVAFGFISGGLIYYSVNKLLDKKGAAIRHPALAKFYYLKKKQEEAKEILNQLSKVELVRSLPPEEMEGVLTCVEPVNICQGEIIFHQGEPGNALYFISDGLIEIKSNANGDGKIIATLGPGQSFGEMALLTGEPRSAAAIAKSDISLLKIAKDHFDALMEISPTLHRAVLQLNSQRILHNVQQSNDEMDIEHWKKIAVSNIRSLSKVEELSYMKKHAAAGNPFAMFLGAMLDTIPESIIIGASFLNISSYKFTFLLAVFLSNLPEAMGSSTNMKEAGFRKKRIFTLWGVLIAAGAVAAALGNIFLISAPPAIITLVEAIAGGGILAMVASVMMPEAYEDGGAEVGLATIAGFLTAFLFTLL